MLFFIMVCTVAVSSSAQNFKPLRFTEYNLQNGLHVILRPDHSTPVVSTVLHYRVGARYEDPARTGFAHFFEHLMFEGSDSIPRGGVGQMVQAVGGEVNAFTSFDKTVYHFKVPSNAVQLALWIDAQRMRELKIDTIGVETQRGVVKEERKVSYDNRPYGTWNEKTRTQCHSSSCSATSASRRCHRSMFFTGALAAVRQPRAFQPWIQVVMPFFTYSLSV